MNIKTTKSFHSPIFITGVPRSGTSMTAGILAEFGVFTGATVPPGVSNPKGFFENVEIRESVLKGILKASHFCPLGVKSLPPEDFIGKFNFGDGKSLKDILRTILTKQGYLESQTWLYKDPKLSLVWRIFNIEFPNALWITVRRNRHNVIRSCLRTHFMARHSENEEFWYDFVSLYEKRLDQLNKSVGRVVEVNTDQLVKGDYKPIQEVSKNFGISFSEEKIDKFISIEHWNR